MIKMIENSLYESQKGFLLIKRARSNKKKDIWTVKKMNFSEKYIAKIFNIKKFLVIECIFKLVYFCKVCRGSGIYFT